MAALRAPLHTVLRAGAVPAPLRRVAAPLFAAQSAAAPPALIASTVLPGGATRLPAPARAASTSASHTEARPSILTGAADGRRNPADVDGMPASPASATPRAAGARRAPAAPISAGDGTAATAPAPAAGAAAAGADATAGEETAPPPYAPTLEVPALDPADVPLMSQRWERRRLSWLVTGSADPPPAPSPAPGQGRGASAAAAAAAASRAVADASALSARLAALRRLRKRKPVKVNVRSILQFITDPARPVIAFTKPLPLPNMVGIMVTAWETEGLLPPGAAGGAGGAPGGSKLA